MELIDDFSQLKELTLLEEFVDDEFKRNGVTPKCEKFFDFLKVNYRFRRGTVLLTDKIIGRGYGNIIGRLDLMPISMPEIYSMTDNHKFTCIMWMRMLWKAGKVRRFVEGRWSNHFQTKGRIQGQSWGVRYLWD